MLLSKISMEGGGGGGGGGGVSSGGSASGSISTVSKEDNFVLSSEVSSPYPDGLELELGLGLSLGCGGRATSAKSKPAPWGQYARILTAKDFPSMGSKVSSASSSSSATKTNNASSCGTKRSADSFSPPRSGVGQVVGWPPVRTYRMNSLVNQTKSPISKDCNSPFENSKCRVPILEEIDDHVNRNNESKAKCPKITLFVKVNMDGTPIGRKVDLNAQNCYETLARTLDDMFCSRSTNISARTSYAEKHGAITEAAGSLRLLDESSDFVLTYEDKDGDWMLVGDVPWEMFINSVKRLRIMRTSEANGLAPRLQWNERERTESI